MVCYGAELHCVMRNVLLVLLNRQSTRIVTFELFEQSSALAVGRVVRLMVVVWF